MKNLILVVLSILPFLAQAQIELGTVNWLRNMEEAQARSKAEDKDILVLFQEVPGCSTCRNFGKEILSDEKLVDIIEDAFVPLAIFNNKKGHDFEILNFYKEPTWNNPVMRIVNAEKDNVNGRLAGQYSLGEVKTYLKQYFEAKEMEVPAYLRK